MANKKTAEILHGCDPLIESCGYQLIPPISPRSPCGCIPGTGVCSGARLLEAEKSNFHTKDLIKATEAINLILERIPKDPKRKLSFLYLPQGTFLAWVEHGVAPVKGAITANSDPSVIAKGFKLISK